MKLMRRKIELLETKTWTNEVDRTNWPSGAWDNEPDRKQWEDKETGLPCLIIRNDLGNLCGYVGVDKNHIFFHKEYYEINVEVHGGLTYSGECNGRICHEANEIKEENETWWLGFDCAHYGDFSPGLSKYRGFDLLNEVIDYKDLTYVEGECEALAKQIKNYA